LIFKHCLLKFLIGAGGCTSEGGGGGAGNTVAYLQLSSLHKSLTLYFTMSEPPDFCRRLAEAALPPK